MHQENKHPNRLPAWSLVLLLAVASTPMVAADEVDSGRVELTSDHVMDIAGIESIPDASFPKLPTVALAAQTTAASFCEYPGPDAGGYTCDEVSYSWLSTAGGSTLSPPDNGFDTVVLPFSFQWYGIGRSTAYVGSNGLTCFTAAGCGAYQASGHPESTGPNDFIACFWDRLDGTQGGSITYKTIGSSPNRVLAISYVDVLNHADKPMTFQIQLHENGDAICMLDRVWSNSSNTLIGTENPTGTSGVRYNLGSMSTYNLGIIFSTNNDPANGSGFWDNFNDGIPDVNKWTYAGTSEKSDCGGTSSPNALKFEGSGVRSATTALLNTVDSPRMLFAMRHGTGPTGSDCATPAWSSHGLQLDYSIDAGASWTKIVKYYGWDYPDWQAEDIRLPSSARTTSTMFRWHMSVSSNYAEDSHWAIDDVSIPGATAGADSAPPKITGISSSTHPSSSTWYNTADFTATITAYDSISGVQGYSYRVGIADPDCIVDSPSNTVTIGNVGSQGTFTFRARAIDNAGNCSNTSSYTFKVDTVAPEITDLFSTSHPSTGSGASTTWPWYNNGDIDATAQGNDPAGGSGFAGFSYTWTTGSTQPQCSKTPSVGAFSSSGSLSKLGEVFGNFKLRVRAVDNAGNCSPVETINTNVDTIKPEITQTNPEPGEQVGPTNQNVRVEYADVDAGQDNSQATTVDPSKVKFFVDGVDRTANAVITENDLTYQPGLFGWTSGSHILRIEIADEAIGAETVTETWSFTANPAAVTDDDGDLFPDALEATYCQYLDNEGTNLDGTCEGDDYTPPAAGLDILEELSNDLVEIINGSTQKSPVKISFRLFD